MKQILDAILAGDTAAVGELDVPEHYRGITVHADEAEHVRGSGQPRRRIRARACTWTTYRRPSSGRVRRWSR